jgi:hypothetical protein
MFGSALSNLRLACLCILLGPVCIDGRLHAREFALERAECAFRLRRNGRYRLVDWGAASAGGADGGSLVCYGAGTSLRGAFGGGGGVDCLCLGAAHNDVHETGLVFLLAVVLVQRCDAEELAHRRLLQQHGLAHGEASGGDEPDADRGCLPTCHEEDEAGHAPQHEGPHAGSHHFGVAGLAAVAEHDVHGSGHERGQQEVAVADGQVSDPAEAAGLHAWHREPGHGAHELEGAETEDGLHKHGGELFHVAQPGALADGVDARPGLHDAGLVARRLRGFQLIRQRLGDADQGGLASGLVGGLEVEREGDGADEDGGRGDCSPPGQASHDVNVLQNPLDGRGRAVAVVQADCFEVADALGHVADGIAGGGDLDVVECDGVKVVGSGAGGIDGCRCRRGRGSCRDCGGVSEGSD